MTDTPQKRGRAWESEFAASIGGRVVPMSGAGFAKLDVRGANVLWSLKYTEHDSFRVSNDLFREAMDAIYSPGGVGGDVLPGLALNIRGHEYIVLRKEDAVHLMTNRDMTISEAPDATSKRYRSSSRMDPTLRAPRKRPTGQ